jgi:hypothetical protein
LPGIRGDWLGTVDSVDGVGGVAAVVTRAPLLDGYVTRSFAQS